MFTRVRNIEQMVDEQLNRWSRLTAKPKQKREESRPVITISREPGTGGTEVSRKLAEALGMDFMSGQIIQQVAESVRMSEKVVASLDEKNITRRDDWLTALFETRHLWPDRYLRHLMKVIGTIGRHGNAVILGRGANYILPPEETFRVRLIAPREARIAKSAEERGIPRVDAEKYVIRTDADRKAFVRKYFHAEISNPAYYDLVIDTSRVGVDGTVEAIRNAFTAWKAKGARR